MLPLSTGLLILLTPLLPPKDLAKHGANSTGLDWRVPG
jgi:hypothetical protein